MEQLTKEPKLVNTKYALKAIDYNTFKKMVIDLLAENKVTGPVQSETLLAYTKLNVHRIQRIDKTLQILPEVKAIIENITIPQTWLVITEGWCGDAAQIMPALNGMAALNKDIQLRFLLRDENLDLMDQYLTNNTGMSIPRLIVYNTDTNEELFNWGPRPAEVQEMFYDMKAQGVALDQIKEAVHLWYARDRTYSIQKEISSLIEAVNVF